MKLKRLHQNATIPTKAHLHDAGWDLYAISDGTINSQEQSCIPLGIAITVPLGTYGCIAPRSGLAHRHEIDVMAGVIDHGYTGEVCVILRNHGTEIYEYKKGDRIAQLIITKKNDDEIEVVDELLSESRGGGGFGSSGN